MLSYQYGFIHYKDKDYHHNDKTVMRPSYHYDGNPYTWKNDLYNEMEARLYK